MQTIKNSENGKFFVKVFKSKDEFFAQSNLFSTSFHGTNSYTFGREIKKQIDKVFKKIEAGEIVDEKNKLIKNPTFEIQFIKTNFISYSPSANRKLFKEEKELSAQEIYLFSDGFYRQK